jgi:subtilase family serine protease
MLRAVDRGALDASQELDLVLALRAPDKSVDVFTAARSRAGLPALTPSEFGDQFGPSVADYARLVSALESRGFTIVRQEPSRTSVTVRASVGDVESSFHTRIRQYQDAKGDFYAPAVEPAFIYDLALIQAVKGLDTAQRYHLFLKQPPSFGPDAKQGSQGPADLRTLYGADVAPASSFLGEGETVAILSAGYLPSVSRDVDSFNKKFMTGFDSKSQYTQIFLGGPSRESPTEANTEYGENLLDIDAVMGVAPKASVVHVAAATTNGLFGDSFFYALNQIPQAHAVSVSWGGCERESGADELLTDAIFQQAKAQGQMWFFPTGDDGTDECRDGIQTTVISASWPAASTYVIASGGTTIDKTGTEVTWNYAGGGQSEWFAKPAYQLGVGPYKDDGVRDQPDVSAMSDSIAVVANGQTSSASGTSCAAPILAALWVILDEAVASGKGIRNGHEKLYAMGKGGVGFNDITKGDIGAITPGFTAGPGYDLATGWGTLNLANIITNWNNF